MNGAIELSPGQGFRGLLIHSLLNRGAMGAAYLASHPVLKTPLIVKTFAPMETDPFREAHLAARVHSPFVVGVIDAGYEGAMPFVVQRYVDGIDLGELIARMRAAGRHLPTRFLVRLVADIALGLHAIHQAGVLHRDIKPENLFLSGDGHALLGDFGVAMDRTRRAESSQLAGTPVFIAPELWRGETIDRRADIYSLGATAHLLATCEPPFVGGSVPELAKAHVETQYVQPTSKTPAEAYLFKVIASMLEKQPGLRPSGADDVAALLEPIAADHPPLTMTSATTAQMAGMHIELYRGDLAMARADVLVNAANSELSMELGVARALRAAGGDEIEREAQAARPASMGVVVWTGPGRLQARWVAHAVSAMSGAVCLQRCTLRVLLEAQARRARTVVFPALGTGVGEVPMALGAKLMLSAMMTVASIGRGSLERISVVLYNDAALEQWATVLSAMDSAVPGVA